MNSGGHEAWASPPTGWYVGTSGTLSLPFKFTFSGAGDYLLCGYVQSDFSTSAAGQLRGVVTSPAPRPHPPTPPAPPPAPARPAVVHAPRISRTRHALVCRPGTWSNTPSRVSYVVRAGPRSQHRVECHASRAPLAEGTSCPVRRDGAKRRGRRDRVDALGLGPLSARVEKSGGAGCGQRPLIALGTPGKTSKSSSSSGAAA